MTARPLPVVVLALIDRIVRHVPEADAAALLLQARAAVITDEVPGCSIDLEVPSDRPLATLPDGPVRPIPAVRGSDGELVGELILWVKSGRIIGVEQPWFGDLAPTGWPEASALDFS